MDAKKVSFGFKKIQKPSKIIVEEKKDFIECVDEKSIVIIGGEEKQEVNNLVIPMQPNTLITAERFKKIAEEVEKDIDETEIKDISQSHVIIEKPPENETLDQMAARELLEEAAKKRKPDNSNNTLSIPAVNMQEGRKESTLDDYESVPIQDYGLAMLRGMGWAPGNEHSKYKPPQLRPKGLGLGADKVIKDNKKKQSSNKEEELTIVANGFVKITTGKYSGAYGKVISLDEDNGRVLVDITVKKETVSLSEFMMQAVTKSEYDRESRVINADSYEEYKKRESTSSKNREGKSQGNGKNYDRNMKERHAKSEREERISRNELTSTKLENNDESDNILDRKRFKRENSYSPEKSKKQRRYSSDSDRDVDKRTRNRSRTPRRDKYKKRHSSSESESNFQKNYRKSMRSPEKRNKKSKYSSESEDDQDFGKKDVSHKSSENVKRLKEKKYSSDSESDSRRRKKDRRYKSKSPELRKESDKKRKGKKKKRDRDRSPGYKKHKK